MRRLARTAVILVAFLASACGPKSPAVAPTTLGWIRSDGKALRDEYGRQWLYRGINARVSGLFDVTFSDGRQPVEAIPDFTEDDITQMAAAGFNLLRLPINWSGVEPMEGQFAQAYLDRLTQVIGWCKAAGIYVLVDFHQDAYSKEIGEDGAPLWAIDPAPTMLLGGPLNDLNQRRESMQVMDAFKSFFTNADMLQDRFVPAWKQVVSLYVNEAAVVGYEPMNEPVAFNLPNGEDALQAFYEKVGAAFRIVDTKHALWLEPDSDRNLTLQAPARAKPFPDANVVYAPHMYPALVSVPDNTEAEWVAALEQSFDGILDEASSYGAAPILGEWGQKPGDPSGLPYIQAVQQLLEERNLGEAFWLWKEESQGSWGFFDHQANGSWTVRADGLKSVALPYPMAVPGSLTSFHFDAGTTTLTVHFTGRGGEAAPVLYLPAAWYPHGVSVKLNGSAVTLGTGRVLLPWSGEAGDFTLEVTSR